MRTPVKDGSHQPVLGHGHPHDLFPVHDEADDVSAIVDLPLLASGDRVQPDDMRVKRLVLPELCAAISNLNEDVLPLVCQWVEEVHEFHHATAKLKVRLGGGVQHLRLGAVTVDGVEPSVREVVLVFHLEDQPGVADPREVDYLVFILLGASEQFPVGEPDGHQVVLAIAGSDGGQPLAVRGEAHSAKLRILKEGLDRQFFRLAKRYQAGQGQAKSDPL